MSRSVLVILCAALVACGGAPASLYTQARPGARGSRDFVPIEELRRYRDSGSLFELLSRIRPSMVRPRAGFNAMREVPEGVDVFINGGYAGGAEVLHTLQPAHVAAVKMVQRSQAFAQYGGLLRGEHVLFITLLR